MNVKSNKTRFWFVLAALLIVISLLLLAAGLVYIIKSYHLQTLRESENTFLVNIEKAKISKASIEDAIQKANNTKNQLLDDIN